MLVYKGFIKVEDYGVFYPISQIMKLIPCSYNPTKTNIVFNDGKVITIEASMLRTIDMLNGIKEVEKV